MKHKIETVPAFFLLSLAILFDGIQFLLTLTVVGSLFSFLVTIIAALVFGLWFALLGVNYFGKGGATKLLTALGSTVIELIPIVDALPGISLGVAALIAQTRVEDAREAADLKARQHKQQQVQLRQQQANRARYQAANDNQEMLEAANDNGDREKQAA